MPKPRIVFMDVHIDQLQPLKFRVEPSQKNDPQLPTDANGDVVFENDHHPGFDIHFELQGDTHGYFFPDNNQKKAAIWSQFGTVCPDQEPGIWDVLKPVRTVESGCAPGERRTLIVHNKNEKPCVGKFMYNLRVVNSAGKWLPLDPGGTNSNGPTTLSASAYIAAGVAGAVAGSLLTLGAQALLEG
jgi:hypothetical protein